MGRFSPAVAVVLSTAFIALTVNGIAGIAQAKRKPHQVLGATVTVGKSFTEDGGNFVACPLGYLALGATWDSWQPPHWTVSSFEPMFRNPRLNPPYDGYRDTGDGVLRSPVYGPAAWYVNAKHSGSGSAPLQVRVFCSKIVTIEG